MWLFLEIIAHLAYLVCKHQIRLMETNRMCTHMIMLLCKNLKTISRANIICRNLKLTSFMIHSAISCTFKKNIHGNFIVIGFLYLFLDQIWQILKKKV